MIKRNMLIWAVCLCFFSNGSTVQGASQVDFSLKEDEAAISFFPLFDGEATLLQDGTDRVILINTGSKKSRKELAYWLDFYHIKQINQVIITKQSEKYNGNVDWVTKKYQVEEVVLPKGSNDLQSQHIRMWQGRDVYQLSKHIHVSVLYHEEVNSPSMDLIIAFGEHQMLYMSNSASTIERHLLMKPLKKIDLIKLANFGEGEPLSESFLKQLNPQIGVLFSKEDRTIHPELVSRLTDGWVELYDTNKRESLSIKMSPTIYDVMKFKKTT
ncbi:hydrolase [Priestia flexa]|uniref:Hydrolase n=1 Tax=Priestia flexa TaxID=86664 RepID=A0ABU4J2D7_9BACI|nr:MULTISPECIES: hypothetical protein [Bacillaceae]MCA1201489.1 hydrolase [Priestia flexa]MCP1188814.1 hydrolase [Priestia flexa]MDW8515172.1 hydrolase [Priestia flexa]MED3823681.1 hydrolase [Priestia flexa]QCS53631.1 hydrolase [Priestia flexa]